MSAKRQLKEDFKALCHEMAAEGVRADFLHRLERIVGELRQQHSLIQDELQASQATQRKLAQQNSDLAEAVRLAAPRIDAAEQRRVHAEAQLQRERAAHEALSQKVAQQTADLTELQNRLQSAEESLAVKTAKLREAETQLAQRLCVPATTPYYRTQMIRDFLNHLRYALQLAYHEYTNDGSAPPDLLEQLEPFKKKYCTLALLKVTRGNLNPAIFPLEVNVLRGSVAAERQQQLAKLEALHELMAEALACAEQPRRLVAQHWEFVNNLAKPGWVKVADPRYQPPVVHEPFTYLVPKKLVETAPSS